MICFPNTGTEDAIDERSSTVERKRFLIISGRKETLRFSMGMSRFSMSLSFSSDEDLQDTRVDQPTTSSDRRSVPEVQGELVGRTLKRTVEKSRVKEGIYPGQLDP